MKAKEIMTPDPAICRPETPLTEVARLMCNGDCGVIPVVDAQGKPMGMVTDRDITCRIVASGKDARQAEARDCMSGNPITVTMDTGVNECLELLEKHQLRRLVVVDGEGVCRGVIAQADIARHGSKGQTAELVREVSKAPGKLAQRPAPAPMF